MTISELKMHRFTRIPELKSTDVDDFLRCEWGAPTHMQTSPPIPTLRILRTHCGHENNPPLPFPAVLPTLLAFVSGRSATAKLAFFYQTRAPASATRRSASPNPRHNKGPSPNGRRRISPIRGEPPPAAPRVVYSQSSQEDGPLPGHSAAPHTPSASVRGAGGAELFLADPRRHVLRGTCIYFLRAGGGAGPPSPSGASRGPSGGSLAAAETQRAAFSSLVGRITCGDIAAPVAPRAGPRARRARGRGPPCMCSRGGRGRARAAEPRVRGRRRPCCVSHPRPDLRADSDHRIEGLHLRGLGYESSSTGPARFLQRHKEIK
jgi:hypothetical protein